MFHQFTGKVITDSPPFYSYFISGGQGFINFDSYFEADEWSPSYPPADPVYNFHIVHSTAIQWQYWPSLHTVEPWYSTTTYFSPTQQPDLDVPLTLTFSRFVGDVLTPLHYVKFVWKLRNSTYKYWEWYRNYAWQWADITCELVSESLPDPIDDFTGVPADEPFGLIRKDLWGYTDGFPPMYAWTTPPSFFKAFEQRERGSGFYLDIEAPTVYIDAQHGVAAGLHPIGGDRISDRPARPTITRNNEKFVGPEEIEIVSHSPEISSPIVPVLNWDWWTWDDEQWIHKTGREVEFEFETDTPKNVFLTITANDGAMSSAKLFVPDPTSLETVGSATMPDGARILATKGASGVEIRRLNKEQSGGDSIAVLPNLSRPRLTARNGELTLLAKEKPSQHFITLKSIDGGTTWH